LLTARGFASIFLEKDNRLELIYTMSETITRETLILQPGKYRLIYRPKQSRRSIYTKEKVFTVISGGSSQVRL